MKLVVDEYPSSKEDCLLYDICGQISKPDTVVCDLSSAGCRNLVKFESELARHSVHQHGPTYPPNYTT